MSMTLLLIIATFFMAEVMGSRPVQNHRAYWTVFAFCIVWDALMLGIQLWKK